MIFSCGGAAAYKPTGKGKGPRCNGGEGCVACWAKWCFARTEAYIRDYRRDHKSRHSGQCPVDFAVAFGDGMGDPDWHRIRREWLRMYRETYSNSWYNDTQRENGTRHD